MARPKKAAAKQVPESARKSTRKATQKKPNYKQDDSLSNSDLSSMTSFESTDSKKRKTRSPMDSEEEVFAKPVKKPTKAKEAAVPKKKVTATKRSKDARKSTATSSRVSSSVSNTESTKATKVQEIMREIFTNSQQVHYINKCLVKLERLMREADFDEAYAELKRNVKFALQGEEKSPFTKTCLEFISKFFIKQWKKDNDKENRENSDDKIDMAEVDELGLECLGRDSMSSTPRKSLVDVILSDVLIPNLSNASVTARFNAGVLIRKMFTEVEDIATDVYDNLKVQLVYRLADKNAMIRSVAARSLHRFQEVDNKRDIVTSAFLFHLNSDPDSEVRQSILYAIEPGDISIPDIILRTRDVKDMVRKVAYHKLAERVSVHTLSIEQRLILLQEGLRERSPSVRKIVEKELVANWLKACDGDIVRLLVLLDIQSDVLDTIEMLLNLIFKNFLNQHLTGSKTKLHIYVERFKAELLDSRNLLTAKPLNVENSFLWRCLVKFCHENETKIEPFMPNVGIAQDKEEEEIDQMLSNIRIPDLETSSREGSQERGSKEQVSSSQESDRTLQEGMEEDEEPTIIAAPSPPKKKKVEEVELDLQDLVTPQLPHFCSYLKKFVKKILSNDFDDEAQLEFEFIYAQLTQLLLMIPVCDDAQKKIMVNSLHEIMFLPEVSTRLGDVVTPLMRILAKNAFKTTDELLNFTRDITHEVHNSIIDVSDLVQPVSQPETSKPKDPVDPEHMRKLDSRYAKLLVDSEELRDEIEANIKEQNFMKAEELKQKRLLFEKEKDEISKERFLMNHPEAVEEEEHCGSQNSQQTGNTAAVANLSDHPDALLKCLQIFSGCLEFGDFKEVDAFIQSHIDNIVFPGMLSEDARLRMMGIKALGLVCFISTSHSKQYFALFVQVVQHDCENVRVMALKAFFDMICQHGIDAIIAETDESKANKANKQAEREIAAEANLSMADEVEDELNENEEDVPDEDPNQMSYDKFIGLLSNLIEEQLAITGFDEVKFTVVQAIGKLLTLGKIYAPNLLTRLLLIWYNPNSTQKIKNFLGMFFPFFAYSDNKSRNVTNGQSTFEECYVDTIVTAFKGTLVDETTFEVIEATLSPILIENMTTYMTQMLGEDAAVRVFISVANNILNVLKDEPTREEVDDLAAKYLMKALIVLPIEAATKGQLKEIRSLLEQIAEEFTQHNKSPCLRRVAKISEKVDNFLSKLGGESDSSQLSNLAAVDKTVIEGDATTYDKEDEKGDDDQVDEVDNNAMPKANDGDTSAEQNFQEPLVDEDDGSSDLEINYSQLNESTILQSMEFDDSD